MGSGSKDSGRSSSSKKGSGSSSQPKKGKSTVSKKGKETYQQPIEEQYEGDEYVPDPPGSSVFGGTGDWTQNQLQAARSAGNAADREDISLSSGYSLNTQSSQVAGYSDMSGVQYTGSGAYYESSQLGTGSSSAYPTDYSQPTTTYTYNTVKKPDPSLEEGFRSLNIQTPNQNYQYANTDQLFGQSNQGISMNTGFDYRTYNTVSVAQYGNSSQDYETPRASKPISIGGDTHLSLQASGHSNRQNQKLLGQHSYDVHKSKEYVVGHVLKTFWFEPAGSTSGKATQLGGTQLMAKNKGLPGKVRRFIIIQSFKGHSIAVPISTYGDQGTTKRGCHPEVHSMIYTNPEPGYLVGERPLRNPKIRMQSSGPETLAKASRINYAKRYTIEHNLRVCFIGRIARESSDDFWMTLNQVNTSLVPPAPADDDDDDDDFQNPITTGSGGGGPGGGGPGGGGPSSGGGGAGRSRHQTSSSSKSGSKGGGKSHKDKRYHN